MSSFSGLCPIVFPQARYKNYTIYFHFVKQNTSTECQKTRAFSRQTVKQPQKRRHIFAKKPRTRDDFFAVDFFPSVCYDLINWDLSKWLR